MNEKSVLIFLAGFAAAMILARTEIGREFVSGGNKFFS